MDDLVKRLREPVMHVKHGQDLLEAWRLERAEAADRIEELEVKLVKLWTFFEEIWDSQGYDARELHDLLKELNDE